MGSGGLGGRGRGKIGGGIGEVTAPLIWGAVGEECLEYWVAEEGIVGWVTGGGWEEGGAVGGSQSLFSELISSLCPHPSFTSSYFLLLLVAPAPCSFFCLVGFYFVLLPRLLPSSLFCLSLTSALSCSQSTRFSSRFLLISSSSLCSSHSSCSTSCSSSCNLGIKHLLNSAFEFKIPPSLPLPSS